VHHLTGYELGDGEGDNLGRTVDVGDHPARLCTGEATKIGAQTQLDLLRVGIRLGRPQAEGDAATARPSIS
jgi:hypothetical protein